MSAFPFEESCPAVDQFLGVVGLPIAYEPSFLAPMESLRRAHEFTPRFGHSSDINQLLRNEDPSDYVVGVLAASVAIFGLMILWLIILLTLRCLGQSRVGFLSGSPIPLLNPPPSRESFRIQKPEPELSSGDEADAESSDNERAQRKRRKKKHRSHKKRKPSSSLLTVPEDEELEDGLSVATETSTKRKKRKKKSRKRDKVAPSDSVPTVVAVEYDDEAYQAALFEFNKVATKCRRKHRRIRITILFSAVGIVASAVLMTMGGVWSLKDAFGDALSGLDQAETLTNQAVSVVDNFSSRQESARSQTVQFMDAVNSFCPNKAERICTDLIDGVACNATGLPLVDEIIDVIEGARQVLYGELGDLRSDLVELGDIFADMSHVASQFYWAFYVGVAFAWLVALAALAMVIIVVREWMTPKKGSTSCTQVLCKHFVAIPTFLFCVVLCWLFSMVFVIGSTTVADMCYESPDSKVIGILEDNRDRFKSSVFDYSVYYVGACRESDLPIDFESYIDRTRQFLLAIEAFMSSLANLQEDQLQACGIPFEVISATASSLYQAVCTVLLALIDVHGFFACGNWRPLYETVAYSAVCTNLHDGLNWVVLSQFFIFFLGMVVVTLRSGFYTRSITTETRSHADGSPSHTVDPSALEGSP